MDRKYRKAAGMLIVVFAGFLLPPSVIRAAESETALSDSGIRYPGGFDPNTVGDVTGKVSGVHLPEQGPVLFRLDTGRESYTVLASASWYWKDLGIDLAEGTEVRVRGSKTLGKDGNLYVVAQNIRITGSNKSFSLRDSAGSPLWGGGSGRGMNSPGGGGMMGGRPGGMERGGGMGGGRRR